MTHTLLYLLKMLPCNKKLERTTGDNVIFKEQVVEYVGNRAWQRNENKENSIPTKDPCKYMCIYNS